MCGLDMENIFDPWKWSSEVNISSSIFAKSGLGNGLTLVFLVQ